MTMENDDRLRIVGEALFGDHWRMPLTSALKMQHARLVYLAKRGKLPDEFFGKLGELVDAKAAALNKLSAEMKSWDWWDEHAPPET